MLSILYSLFSILYSLICVYQCQSVVLGLPCTITVQSRPHFSQYGFTECLLFECLQTRLASMRAPISGKGLLRVFQMFPAPPPEQSRVDLILPRCLRDGLACLDLAHQPKLKFSCEPSSPDCHTSTSSLRLKFNSPSQSRGAVHFETPGRTRQDRLTPHFLNSLYEEKYRILSKLSH